VPDIFGNPTSGELNEDFRQRSANAAFKSAQREIQTLEENLETLDIEPPSDPGPGALESLLDFISTPGQFVSGAVAGLTNTPGFKDKNLLDAAIKGTEDDLTVADIFRKQGVFKDSPVLRGVAGFVGDVALDPVSYVTLGGGVGAKIGRKTLSKKALKTRLGKKATPDEIILNRNRDIFEDLVAKEKKRLKTGELAEDQAEYLNAKIKAEQEAVAPFKEAQAFLKKRRDLEAKDFRGKSELDRLHEEGGEAVVAAEAAVDDLAAQEKRIRDALDLDDTQPLEDLFKKNAIRGAGIIPAVGEGYSSLPAFLSSPGFDIPVVTASSEVIFDALSGPLYNASVGVGKTLDKAVDAAKKSDITPLIFAAGIMQGARKFPTLVSRRFQAGSDVALDLLRENEMQRSHLANQVDTEARNMFEKWFKLGGDDEGLEAFGRQMEAGLKANLLNAGNELADDIDTGAAFERAVQATARIFNQQRAGLGDEGARLARLVREDFNRYAEEGRINGFLNSEREEYFAHLYKAPEKMPFEKKKEIVAQAMQNIQRRDPNFSFERTFTTLDDAFVTSGLLPEFNLRKVWFHRTVQQRLAKSEKDFLERAGYEIALPRKTYDAIKAAVASKNERVSRAALEFLRRRDISPQDAVQTAMQSVGVDEAARLGLLADKGKTSLEGLSALKYNGEFFSVRRYDELKRVAQGNPGLDATKDAQKVANDLGLTFSNKERETVLGLNGFLDEYRTGLMGRAGETNVGRAGAEMPNEKFRQFVARSDSLSPEEKNYFNGVIPRSFAQALDESLDRRGTLSRFSDFVRSRGDTDMAEAYVRAGESYLGWVKNLKLGATLWWPAFHARNFVSAQLQGTKAASTLGEAFNPFKLYETYKLRRGGAGGIKNIRGEFISGRQLELEAKQFGFLNESASAMVDVQNHITDQLASIANKTLDDPKHGKGFWSRVMSTAREDGKGLQLAVAENLGATNFANFIENFGREHLYFQLRKQGLDASTAANQVRTTMIDYARGKTKFERDVLNNLFFFYSFARGELANTMTAMVTRPGGLTSQLHAVEGVAEILRDPNAIPLPEGMDEQLKTLRGQETISRFIGRSDDGFPKLIQGFGVPIEELGKFINLRAPRELTMQSLIDAGAHNTRRAMTNTLANLNPILKTPLEFVTDHSFFFERPLSDESLRKVAKFEEDYDKLLAHPFDAIPESVFKTINKANQTLLNARDNGDGTFTADWKRLAWLSQLVPGYGRALSTARAATNKSLDLDERILRSITGVRPLEVDPGKSEVFARREQLREFVRDQALPRSKRKVNEVLEIREALKREVKGK